MLIFFTKFKESDFLTFPADFYSHFFFNFNCNWSKVLDLRNLQNRNKLRKHSASKIVQFTVQINCSSDLENKNYKFEVEGRKFQNIFLITRTTFLNVGQNNFGNKISFIRTFFKGGTKVNISSEIKPSLHSTLKKYMQYLCTLGVYGRKNNCKYLQCGCYVENVYLFSSKICSVDHYR